MSVLADVRRVLGDEWWTVHDIAAAIHGPTERVWQNGRHVEVPTTASGSGIESALNILVAEGIAEVKKDWRAPLGKLWRKSGGKSVARSATNYPSTFGGHPSWGNRPR